MIPPTLFHVTTTTALPLIRQHGLLSAKALCHLFEVPAAQRPALLTHNRDGWASLSHPLHGTAHLRRQGMRDGPLRSRLAPGIGTGQWRRFINRHVFLCATRAAAERLMQAEPLDQVILEIPAEPLRHALLWCPYNNGYLDRSPPHARRLRAPTDYRPIATLGPGDTIAELAFPGRIPPALL